jgi:hypothetical protein
MHAAERDSLAMNAATLGQRVILDAAIDRSVIHGTLTAPSGARRDFYGWLELNTALEAILDTRADRARNDSPAASAVAPANARARPATQSINAPTGGRAPRPAPSAQ